MKKRFVLSCNALIVSCMLMVSTTWGQEPAISSIRANSKAMLFTFSGLSNLGAFSYNGGIGGKYFLTDPIALRASIQFMGGNQVLRPATVGSDGSISGVRFGGSVGGEYHLLMTRVSPYVGATIGADITSTESKPQVEGNLTQVAKITKNNKSGENIGGVAYAAGSNFNVGLLGGVEFFIVKELSLSAEYQFGFNMNSRADEQIIDGNTTTTTKLGMLTSYGIAAVGILALAVYF
jgi:hypothetical protein